MSYSIFAKHVELEKEFADYIGKEHAVAVGSGGVGIQMLIRALGIESDGEVIIQADTCSAVPQAILNAHAIPVLTDVNTDTFQLSLSDLETNITEKTKMVLATHMWGNPEDIKSISKIVSGKDIYVIEDACLALGGKLDGKFLGTISTAGVFSFGSTKPVQAGEGGMLITDDGDLARELRAMRGWGDRQTEFGTRDVSALSWNGRMPEVIASIALEQLKAYPYRLKKIQERVNRFRKFVADIRDFTIVTTEDHRELSFTQLSLKLTLDSRYTKKDFLNLCLQEQIPVFHANFEPLTELTLFQNDNWLKWTKDGDPSRVVTPNNFPGAYEVYSNSGVGLTRRNFESERNLLNLMKFINRNFT